MSNKEAQKERAKRLQKCIDKTLSGEEDDQEKSLRSITDEEATKKN